jgi:ubiquitin-like domain-containing CTD phosphatase 1
LKTKDKTIKLTDETKFSDIVINPSTGPLQLMMIGTVDEDLHKDVDGDDTSVMNDLDENHPDYVYSDKESEDIVNHKDHRRRLERTLLFMQRTNPVQIINLPRKGKKLLVLDLDYTLFDMKSAASSWAELLRPYAHEFLAAMYQEFDIVIWSQTSWKWLEIKLTELGLLTNPNYKICFVLDKSSMFNVESSRGKHQASSQMFGINISMFFTVRMGS